IFTGQIFSFSTPFQSTFLKKNYRFTSISPPKSPQKPRVRPINWQIFLQLEGLRHMRPINSSPQRWGWLCFKGFKFFRNSIFPLFLFSNFPQLTPIYRSISFL
ncbi:MAG: hypothetical protein C6I01_03200, partial [Epsilonproteobacteria bacterium]|nr:hypothetical protein [Campylobacterota bacterium]